MLALALLVTAIPMASQSSGQSRAYARSGTHTAVDARSIWNPGPGALAALHSLPPAQRNRDGLIGVMRRNGASRQAILFAAAYPGEPAFLHAIRDDGFLGGFRSGEVLHPFRKGSQKGFVMLNGRPPLVDASDVEILKSVHLDAADTLKTLGTMPDRLRCDWAHPFASDAGPGDVPGDTIFDISYPVRLIQSGHMVGTVHVYFQFVYPGWRFLGAKFGFMEKGDPTSRSGTAGANGTWADGATPASGAAKAFVSSFYQWYVPLALAPGGGPASEAVLKKRANDFSPSLLHA